MFVSNSDNLGATMDLKLLTWFATSGAPFAMEVGLPPSFLPHGLLPSFLPHGLLPSFLPHAGHRSPGRPPPLPLAPVGISSFLMIFLCN
jgi:hypothetical protein